MTTTNRSETLDEVLGTWAQNHADRYPDIGVLDYEPDVRPEQHIDTFKTPIQPAFFELPPAQLRTRLRENFERILGASALEAVDAFDPVLEELRHHLTSRRSVAVLTAHADTLHDVGTYSGALALALEKPELIARNCTMLNKVMTRETFRGRPIADLFRHFGTVYWVIPDTTSTVKWGVPPDDTRYINSNALRLLLRDMRDGLLLTYAPMGSTMTKERGRTGDLEALTIPPVPRTAAKLLARFDAYLVAILWDGRMSVGSLQPVPRPERGKEQAIDVAMAEVAARTAELAGVPVTYGATGRGDPRGE